MKRFVFSLLITVSIFGCAVSNRQVPYYPLPDREGFVQEGVASWYGKKFHRKKTASGEIFNMWDKTAAHNTLPFGTHVKVENLSNQREVVVRINDRGPFVKGRIIDLSYGAAREIGLIGPGVTRVRMVALSKEVGKIKSGNTYRPLVEARDFKKGRFAVLVGAFENDANARRLAKRLRVIFDNVTIRTYMPDNGKILYRVRVSTSKDLNEASKIVKKLEYLGFSESFIVAL